MSTITHLQPDIHDRRTPLYSHVAYSKGLPIERFFLLAEEEDIQYFLLQHVLIKKPYFGLIPLKHNRHDLKTFPSYLHINCTNKLSP